MVQKRRPIVVPSDQQARLDHQRQWSVMRDSLLATAVAVWLLVVTLADPGPRLRWAAPLVLTVAVVNRVLVLVEGSYPLRRADVDGPARPPGPPVPGAPQAAAAERAA